MNLRVLTAHPFNASTPLDALLEDVTPTRLHYVRDHFRRPEVREDAWPPPWTVRVDGRVRRPFDLRLDDIPAAREVVVTMECAGNGRTRFSPVPQGVPWDDGAVATQRWAGAPLRDVLARAGVEGDAVEVVFRGADGDGAERYARSLPLADARAADVLLATRMDGAPLGLLHGGPVRLVVPGWYGMASVKWLTEIEVADRPFEGRFQTRDYVYKQNGRAMPVRTMRPKALVLAPKAGATVARGERVQVVGRAWGGDGGVARVDVSVDAGASWHAAHLDAAPGPWAWRRFAFAWTPRDPGAHVLVARATDGAGNVQPLEPPANDLGYGNNAVVPVTVAVG